MPLRVLRPVGALVVNALKATRKGGRAIYGGIHMSDIPSFPYALLWGERRIESARRCCYLVDAERSGIMTE